MEVTNDKILVGFISAVLTLILKACYDAYQTYEKRNDIRKMIVHDLTNQSRWYNNMAHDCKLALDVVKNYRFEIPVEKDVLINTDLFKAHPLSEYFKTFNLEIYSMVLIHYRLIELHSKTRLSDMLVNFHKDRLQCKTESQLEEFTDTYKVVMLKRWKVCVEMRDSINKTIDDIRREYNGYY